MSVRPRLPSILVVDDDATDARVLESVLAREGYIVAVARSGAEARRLLDARRYALAICDLHLPGESGAALVQRIAVTRPEIGVLVVTGGSDPVTAQSLTAVGVYGYLIKPFALDQFLIMVANALRRRELEQERVLYERSLEEAVRARTTEVLGSRREMVRRLVAAVDARDGATALHSERTGRYAAAIARKAGCAEPFCELIGLAAPLHDIGKLAVPDRILHKPGRLTSFERQVMERHTTAGRAMLADSGQELLELAATIAWTHHERLDGRGYPRGLAGDAIPEAGRIVAVADTYDAITSDRPYRPAHTHAHALEVLYAWRGTRLDPSHVDAIVEVLDEESEAADLAFVAVGVG